MSVQIPSVIAAQADQEVAERSEKLHGLMAVYRETVAEGIDRTTAIAALTGGFVQGYMGGGDVSSISAMLAVAIAELVERDAKDQASAPKVLTRSVTCDHGCYKPNYAFDCPIHGGMPEVTR